MWRAMVPKLTIAAMRFVTRKRIKFPSTEDPGESPLGLITGESPEACAEATAAEIARLLESETVIRDKTPALHAG
jgi:hypothetical protein